MITRIEGSVTYTQAYDAENRLTSVTPSGGMATSFTYDANGQRVKTVEPGSKTTYYPFPQYEETVVGSSTIKRSSFAIAGQVVAFRVAGDPVTANNGLFYVFTDHLGSTSRLRKSDEAVPFAGSITHYLPFGGYRGPAPSQTLTDRDFTGQKENRELGLVYYNARFYIPTLGRFASADTLVPNPTNPQSLNRYSYVSNNPLVFIDPSGHIACDSQNLPGQDQAACANSSYEYPSSYYMMAQIVANPGAMSILEDSAPGLYATVNENYNRLRSYDAYGLGISAGVSVNMPTGSIQLGLARERVYEPDSHTVTDFLIIHADLNIGPNGGFVDWAKRLFKDDNGNPLNANAALYFAGIENVDNPITDYSGPSLSRTVTMSGAYGATWGDAFSPDDPQRELAHSDIYGLAIGPALTIDLGTSYYIPVQTINLLNGDTVYHNTWPYLQDLWQQLRQ